MVMFQKLSIGVQGVNLFMWSIFVTVIHVFNKCNQVTSPYRAASAFLHPNIRTFAKQVMWVSCATIGDNFANKLFLSPNLYKFVSMSASSHKSIGNFPFCQVRKDLQQHQLLFNNYLTITAIENIYKIFYLGSLRKTIEQHQWIIPFCFGM